MTIVNKDLYAPSTVTTGLKSVIDDINLIESYHTAAISSGMESLDYPAGKLIEQSLATKYPEYFRIGSGMEGVASLLSNLKVVSSKVKNALKGKTHTDLVTKPTSDALKALDKQYSSGFWGNWKAKEVETVKPTGLLACVKGGSISEIKSQVDTYLTARETELKAGVAGALKYWDGILPVFKKLQTETDEDALWDLLGEAQKYSEQTKMNDQPPESFPKADTGGTLPTLTVEDAKAAADYIKDLLTRSKEIYAIVDPAFEIGIKEDDADAYLDNASKVKGNPPIRYLHKCYNVHALTEEVTGYTEEIRDYMFKVIKGLEEWIEKSTD